MNCLAVTAPNGNFLDVPYNERSGLQVACLAAQWPCFFIATWQPSGMCLGGRVQP